MPKKEVKRDVIDKEVFLAILKEKGTSIPELGEKYVAECSERTLRRSINSGHMRPQYIDRIAKYLDVHPMFLSGELHKKADLFPDEMKQWYLNSLDSSKYPYCKKELDILKGMPIRELLSHIFSLFDVSYSQFEQMTFEKQYALQYELFEAMIPIMRKHFTEDSYGNEDMPELDYILVQLDNYRDDYYLGEHLRERFLDKPPKGVRREKIKKMSHRELIDLGESLP